MAVDNIDLSGEIKAWKDAAYGKDVRAANVAAFEKIQGTVNDTVQNVNQASKDASSASQNAQKAVDDIQSAIETATSKASEAAGSAAAAETSKEAAASSAEAADTSKTQAAASAAEAKKIAQGLGDFDGTASKVKITDTYGLVVSALGESTAQALIDAIANKVMNELINKNKIVNNLLATDASTVLAGTQGTALDKRLVAAENAVAQLNSESFFIPISYFKTNINKTYSDIYTFVFGKLVVLSISILIDSFNNYFGEVTSDIRQIQRLKSLDSKTVKASGIVRSGDNSKTLGYIGSLMYDGSSGKIMANIIGSGSDSNPTSIQNGYVIGELVLFLK